MPVVCNIGVAMKLVIFYNFGVKFKFIIYRFDYGWIIYFRWF